jgi:GNAT superfamily N-acetyltransferase
VTVDERVRAPLGALARLRYQARLARVKGWRRSAVALWTSYMFAWQRWYFFWQATASPAPPTDDQITLRLATLDDLDRLGVFEPHRRRGEFQHWLEAGAWIFLALDGDRPITFHCFTEAPPPVPPLSEIVLRADQLWFEEMYTLPEFRRRRVSSQLRPYRDRILRDRGYSEMVSAVREDNLPALRYIYQYRATLRRIERRVYLRMLWFSRTWIDADARGALETRLAVARLIGPRAERQS